MRALVTGASGFLGAHLCRALRGADHFVVGMVRDVTKHSHEVHCLFDVTSFGTLADIAHLRRLVSEYQIDTVFHLAAQTQVSTAIKDPLSTFEANILGTWNVLEVAREAKVQRLIVASTDKAYGRSDAPYLEGTPLRPDRPYETSKACADLLARTYCETYGMSIAVTRCSNLYGPGHLNWSTLIPGTIRRIVKGERPIVRNGGRMRRDFLFVRDAVDGYMRLAHSDLTGPVNFGTGNPVTVRSVVDRILSMMDSSLAPLDELSGSGEIQDQWNDWLYAQQRLGWMPSYDLAQGLAETIPWYVEHLK